jgi:diguanylate cyclase (GGDEF)-like protein/PAS domain S-box-containing protein
LAIANAGVPILIADADDCVVWANRAIGAFGGVPARMIVGEVSPSFGRAAKYKHAAKFPAAGDIEQPQIHRTSLSGSAGDGSHFVVEAVVTPMCDDKGNVTHFVTVLHDVTQSAAALDEARSQASRDELTGVASRSHIAVMLHAAFGAAQRSQRSLAMLFIDLDGFKEINDSHGHLVGDCLLRAVAARLAGVVRRSDTVARFGGDEFLVLLPAVSGIKAARQIGRHIVRQLSQPFAIGPGLLRISASVGLASCPDHAQSADLLLMRADEAMYQAKARGGNQLAMATRCSETTTQRHFDFPPTGETSCQGPYDSDVAGSPRDSRYE